jgi:hypothetical protein
MSSSTSSTSTAHVASDSAPTIPPSSTAVATRADVPVARAVGGVIAWDPFALMDRLDADAFIAEMQGIASKELVYRIKDGGKETVGLSKGGVDECCTMLVSQGQCIREENIKLEMIGAGEDAQGLFTATIARYAVNPDGREVRLDQVLGVKREPLYEERAPLTMDSKVAGKRWRHLTYAQALENEDATDYLEWVRDDSSFDSDTKRFITLLLDGSDVREFAVGKRFNQFWYEHGCMKAARNARFRMIPAGIRAQVIAMAEAADGKVKVVERAETSEAGGPANSHTGRGNGRGNGGRSERAAKRQPDEPATTETAPAAADEPAAPIIPRREQDTAGWKFPFAPYKGAFLDALAFDTSTGEITGYVVSEKLLRRALAWALDIIGGKAYARANGETKPVTEDDRPRFLNTIKALEYELTARKEEAETASAARAARVPGGETSDDVGSGEQRADPTPAAGGSSGVTDTGNVSSATDASATDAGKTTTATPTTGATTNADDAAVARTKAPDANDGLPFP